MKLLLDSHVLLWALASPEQLRESTRKAIISPENKVFVSAATLWELRLKVAKGKLHLPSDFTDVLIAMDFKELPVKWNHSEDVFQLPAIHGDPFDRLLLYQARTEGLTFVTADQHCLQYPVLLMNA